MDRFKGKKINLGCGHVQKEGYINVDRVFHSDNVDYAWDLNVFPYPWDDCMFEQVLLWNVLEHLDEPIKVIEEIGRILLPKGTLRMRVAGEHSKTRWRDMQHKRPFHIDSFDVFDPTTDAGSKTGFYVKTEWEILEKRLDTVMAPVIEMQVIK